ncbi:MAG: DoxX family protein [Acidobacteria bacterium]|nr:DoxX family protein [Acidobacteriota bacterium]
MSAQKNLLLIVILRFVMGGFWFEHSRDKWEWPQTAELQRRLQRNSENGDGIQKAYVERFALPHWQTLQYLVIFGELAVGLSFLAGFLTRAAAIGGAFMALNFLFAQGALLSIDILGNPYGPVTIMATIVAAYGGGETYWSLSSWLARKRGPREAQ